MLYCDEVPPVVAINEAVHFAKDLSSFQSGRFVNGVLDRIRQERLDRPARTPRSSDS
jgi:N utilization substance protein B